MARTTPARPSCFRLPGEAKLELPRHVIHVPEFYRSTMQLPPSCETVVCPGCFAPLEAERCDACGRRFERPGGHEGHLLDAIAGTPRETTAAEVERFYSASPFPGYAPEDDGASLLDRSRRSSFLDALDRSLPPDALVLDAGCGTGQTAMFLALAGPRRRVIGLDGCRVSLELAEGFRRREQIANLHLVRGDLFDLPLPRTSSPT